MTSGTCTSSILAFEFELDHLLTFAQRLLADAAVLLFFLALGTARPQAFDTLADAVGHARPRKTQRHRHAHHQQRDPGHARARQSPASASTPAPAHTPAHRPRMALAAPIPSDTGASIPAPQLATSSSARPSQNIQRGGSGCVASAWPRSARASDDSQARQVTGTSHQADQPNRKNRPSAVQAPTAPAMLRSALAVARGGESGVTRVVRGQRQQQQRAGHEAQCQHQLPAATHHGGLAWRQRGGAAVALQGPQRKAHAHIVRDGRPASVSRSAGVP
jgi:hypothetical protein